jgi:hypothetical protein
LSMGVGLLPLLTGVLTSYALCKFPHQGAAETATETEIGDKKRSS